ncbi:MAG: hypothetical protein M3P01_13215 [Actinomycetota bacterium]|nr:hypothetical protein [Actinomycetota bacterium]
MTASMERIGTYRAAIRQILRHEGLDTEDRIRAMLVLVGHARAERYADLIVRVLLAELEWSIDRDDVEARRIYDDVMERRARSLRAEGRQICPTCETPLSSATDWSHWRALREQAIREVEAREGAVA